MRERKPESPSLEEFVSREEARRIEIARLLVKLNAVEFSQVRVSLLKQFHQKNMSQRHLQPGRQNLHPATPDLGPNYKQLRARTTDPGSGSRNCDQSESWRERDTSNSIRTKAACPWQASHAVPGFS